MSQFLFTPTFLLTIPRLLSLSSSCTNLELTSQPWGKDLKLRIRESTSNIIALPFRYFLAKLLFVFYSSVVELLYFSSFSSYFSSVFIRYFHPIFNTYLPLPFCSFTFWYFNWFLQFFRTKETSKNKESDALSGTM